MGELTAETAAWLGEAGSAIGAAIGAVVALGGLVASIGRMSRLTRVRRRMNQASAMAKEAHPTLRPGFEALHKEESARYLALVEGRIGRDTWLIAVAAGIAMLSALIVLLSTFLNGSEPGILGETIVMLLMFGIPATCCTGYALEQASRRHEAFIQAYRDYVEPRGATAAVTSDQSEKNFLQKLAENLGPEMIHRIQIVTVALGSTAFITLLGHSLGRHLTENGREMMLSDGPLVSFLVRAGLLALLIISAISGRFLFPELPRAGESLRNLDAESGVTEGHSTITGDSDSQRDGQGACRSADAEPRRTLDDGGKP